VSAGFTAVCPRAHRRFDAKLIRSAYAPYLRFSSSDEALQKGAAAHRKPILRDQRWGSRALRMAPDVDMAADNGGMDLPTAESDDLEHRTAHSCQVSPVKNQPQRPTITRKLRRQDCDTIIDARYMNGCADQGVPMAIPMATELDMDTSVNTNDDHTPRLGGGKTQKLSRSNGMSLLKPRTWQPPRDWLARTVTEQVTASVDSASPRPGAELAATKRLIRR
jgi:hypothetical protein